MKPLSHSFLIVLTLFSIESISRAATAEVRKKPAGTGVLSASELPSGLAAIAPAVEEALTTRAYFCSSIEGTKAWATASARPRC